MAKLLLLLLLLVGLSATAAAATVTTKEWYLDRRPLAYPPASSSSCSVNITLAQCSFQLAAVGDAQRSCVVAYLPPPAAMSCTAVQHGKKATWCGLTTLTASVNYTRTDVGSLPVTVGIWLRGVDIFTFVDAAPTQQIQTGPGDFQPYDLPFIQKPIDHDPLTPNHYYDFHAVVTKYAAVLQLPGQLRMYADIPDGTSAVFPYDIKLTATYHYYLAGDTPKPDVADLVIPISGWKSGNVHQALHPRLCVANASLPSPTVAFKAPVNTLSAVLEVKAVYAGAAYGSFAPFSIAVLLDGRVAGVAWGESDDVRFDNPAMVVYGVEVDITPFVGTLTDGKRHHIAFVATETFLADAAYSCAYQIDANLHVWRDRGASRTTGRLRYAHFATYQLESRDDETYYYGSPSGSGAITTREYLQQASFAGFLRTSAGKIVTTIYSEAHRVVVNSTADDGFRSAKDTYQTVQSATTVVAKAFDGAPSNYSTTTNVYGWNDQREKLSGGDFSQLTNVRTFTREAQHMHPPSVWNETESYTVSREQTEEAYSSGEFSLSSQYDFIISPVAETSLLLPCYHEEYVYRDTWKEVYGQNDPHVEETTASETRTSSSTC
eukprot:jgi/Chlat1/1898/Chrsp147S02212